jgi:hypothetical protein
MTYWPLIFIFSGEVKPSPFLFGDPNFYLPANAGLAYSRFLLFLPISFSCSRTAELSVFPGGLLIYYLMPVLFFSIFLSSSTFLLSNTLNPSRWYVSQRSIDFTSLSNGLELEREGSTLTSRSHGLKLWSIRTSNPYIS